MSHKDNIDHAEECIDFKLAEDAVQTTLEVEGRHIVFDKHLLVENSDYFKAMFSSSMKEAKDNFVKLNGVSYKQIILLLKCLEYGGFKLIVNEDNIFDVTEAALMFQFSGICENCSTFLTDCLSVKNCLKIMLFSSLFFLQDIYNKARSYALWFFSKVRRTDCFLEMSSKDLKAYLSDDCLNCFRESEILLAVSSWCAHDSSRNNLFEDIFKHCLRPSLLTDEDVNGNEFVKNSSESFRIWLKEKIEKKGSDESNSSDSPRSTPCKLLSVGGYTYDVNNDAHRIRKIPSTDVEIIDQVTGEMSKLANLETVLPNISADMGYAVCMSGKDMYVSGGEAVLGKNTWQMKIWKLDIFKRTWEVFATMSEPRRHHGMCVMKNELYLIGGFGKFRKPLWSVERYDLETGDWKPAEHMPQPVINPAVTARGEYLWVVKTQIFYYNPLDDYWLECRTDFCSIPLAVNFAITVQRACYFASKDHFSITKFGASSLETFHVDSPKMKHSDSESDKLDHEPHGGIAYLDGCIFRYCGSPYDNLQKITLREKEHDVVYQILPKSKNRSLLFTIPVYSNVLPS